MKAKKFSFSKIRTYAERVLSTDRPRKEYCIKAEEASLIASEKRRYGTYAMFTHSFRKEHEALTLKIDNTVNLLSMACARSVFKKIDKSSGDETTHAICVDFLKALDKLEALNYASDTAYGFRFNRNGNYKKTVESEEGQRILNNQDLYFHSLDVFSACRLAVYQLMDESGVAVDLEMVRPVKKQTKEVVYGFNDVPEKITNEEMVSGITSIFRAGNQAVYENGAIKESNPKYLYIPLDEFKDEKLRDIKLFRRFNASAFIGGQSSLFACGNATNAELLEKLFDRAEAECGMTKTERRRTELKVNAPYLPWETMARLEGVKSHNAVRKSVAKGLEKLGNVIPEGKAKSAMLKYLKGVMQREIEDVEELQAVEMLEVYAERKKARKALKAKRNAVSVPKCSWINYKDESGVNHHVFIEGDYMNREYLNNKIENVTDLTDLRTYKMKIEHIEKDGLKRENPASCNWIESSKEYSAKKEHNAKEEAPRKYKEENPFLRKYQ